VWFFSFIFAHNDIFFPSFLENENIFHVAVQYIGPAENTAIYKYKVEFVNTGNTESVTVMHLTRIADENLRGIHTSGNCGKLRYDVVFRHRDEEGYLNCKVQIIRVGN
jgi:hypothetical protein